MLLRLAWVNRGLLILCLREIQNSINDSVYRLLINIIEMLGAYQDFEITKTDIVCKRTGSRFIFKGLYRNISSIKSLEGADIAWVEEAQTVSRESLEYLLPTIRKPGSEIWFTFNPDSLEDPVYSDFVIPDREDVIAKKINYTDNPYFPEVLRKEKDWMKKTDHDRYLHIWEGEPRSHSDAQVFKGKYFIEDFEAPPDTRFYYGADWGFSQDPTTLIRCFIQGASLFIDYEAYGVGIEITETPAMFDLVPGSREWPIIADSARPETISHMSRAGFNIRGAVKGK